MHKFPQIRSLDDVLPHIKDKPEIKVKVEDGLTIVCYMFAAESTFDHPVARECRGITFGPDGRILARPLHKFFHVNERPETQGHALPFDRIARVMDKADGSLIHSVAHPSGDPLRWFFKSRKSLTAPQVGAARGFAMERGYVDAIAEVTDAGMTAIFEWCAPDNRIVVEHPDATLRLLHLRDNVTGAYLDADARGLAKRHRIPMVEDVEIPLTAEGLRRYHAETVGVEGIVLQFDDGEMVKLKTRWYLDLHGAMTALRERDVARLALDQKLDDLYAKLATEGIDTAPIKAIEERVIARVREVETEVAALAAEAKGLDVKAIAAKHKGHPLFGLLMKEVRGQAPDYRKFFDAEIDLYSLASVQLGSSVTAEAAE
jgi:T4 RnlA family RNA ligase